MTTAIDLQVTDDDVLSGELALVVPPGTRAEAQTRAIDEALGPALDEHARAYGLVLDAAPSRFTRAIPGKDAEGRMRFAVRARTEGDRLVPAHRKK